LSVTFTQQRLGVDKRVFTCLPNDSRGRHAAADSRILAGDRACETFGGLGSLVIRIASEIPKVIRSRLPASPLNGYSYSYSYSQS
jgi:hypothetical protein